MFKFVLVIQKLGFCLTVFYCFNKVSSQSEKKPLDSASLFLIFSNLFKVISLFSYQGPLSFPVARDSFYILSKLFAFVKNFFNS